MKTTFQICAAAMVFACAFGGGIVNSSAETTVVYPSAPAPVTCAAPQSAVVLDFSISPRVSESRDCCTRRLGYTEKEVKTEKDSRGWWFGHQDIYINSNVGRIAADLISDQLRDAGIYKITSRGNLKYYYADKKDILRDKLKMTDDQLKKAILLLDPVQVGKELGVDKVVVGHICDSELRKAVAPGSFASVASFNVAVFDVKSGQMVFDKCYSKFGNHETQYFLYEKVAKQVSADLVAAGVTR
jgi:hypothetical protein